MNLRGSPAKLATHRNLPLYSLAFSAKKTSRSSFTASNTSGGVAMSTATYAQCGRHKFLCH